MVLRRDARRLRLIRFRFGLLVVATGDGAPEVIERFGGPRCFSPVTQRDGRLWSMCMCRRPRRLPLIRPAP